MFNLVIMLVSRVLCVASSADVSFFVSFFLKKIIFDAFIQIVNQPLSYM